MSVSPNEVEPLRATAPAGREVVAVVLTWRGRVGLFKRSGAVGHDAGKWHCISGHVDSGAGPYRQAVQEIWEATAKALDIATPPLAGDAQCDVAVIGAGYTGLNAALRLRREYGMDVRVLEAGEPGWGASGRNGGFSCIGCHKRSYGSLIKSYGLDDTRRLHGAMKDAVAWVADLCRTHHIDAWIHEGGEISLAHLPNRWAELEEERGFMARFFGEKLELLDVDALKAKGLWAPHFHGGIKGDVGFSVHPLNYVRGLARAAVAVGVKIHGRSRVTRWEEANGRHRLATKGGTLSARHVVVASDNFDELVSLVQRSDTSSEARATVRQLVESVLPQVILGLTRERG